MRRLGLALVAVVGCGGGKGGGDLWDLTANQFAEAACINACVPADLQDECIVDVLADLDQARVEVGPAGEDACIECLQVKIDLVPEFVAQACQSTLEQEDEIEAVCGPRGPGDACAGLP